MTEKKTTVEGEKKKENRIPNFSLATKVKSAKYTHIHTHSHRNRGTTERKEEELKYHNRNNLFYHMIAFKV